MLDIRLCKSRWSEARELIAAAHESNQPQWVVRKEVFLPERQQPTGSLFLGAQPFLRTTFAIL